MTITITYCNVGKHQIKGVEEVKFTNLYKICRACLLKENLKKKLEIKKDK